MPATSATPCFKFIVRSADEAAAMIRERLGGQARVLSVRNVEAAGLARFWSGPRLEIIAQSAPTESDPVAPAIPPPGPAAHRTDLRALLQRSGFSGKMLDRLVRSPDWPDLASRPLHEGLVETGRTLSRWYGPRFTGEPLARAAFIGLPGSGRTTALCKLLALETFRRGRRGHVVMVEFDRLNPAGTLQVFGEVLGLPVSHFPAAPRQPAPGGFVYYDLPGLSLPTGPWPTSSTNNK
jgi:flagellar biosynthesis protein FlhF